MAGVITRRLQLEMTKHLFNDVNDSAGTKYYIGVGKSESWNDSDLEITPLVTEREERNFRTGLQSIKLVNDYTFAITRHNWTTGRVYLPYDDALVDVNSTPYYVLTDENQVYICLKQAKNSLGVAQVSTTKPTGVSANPVFTADNYVWKFLYSISTVQANAFLSSSWMPVKIIDSAGVGDLAVEIEQYGIQNAAIAGQVAGINLVSGGSGYTSIPTVTISGDGTGALAIATISGGSVVKVEIKDSDSTLISGINYNKASIKFSGGAGSGASARPILSPRAGFGADPREDLRTRAVILDIKPSSDETGEWLVNNGFRQIGLIKNPYLYDSAERYLGTTLNMLYAIKLQAAATGFTIGSTLLGLTSGTQAVIDKIDSDLIYYHQNEITGFSKWVAGEGVEDQSAGIGTLSSNTTDYILEPVADPMTGSLLYIENRAVITRAQNQTEDIKIVLQM